MQGVVKMLKASWKRVKLPFMGVNITLVVRDKEFDVQKQSVIC